MFENIGTLFQKQVVLSLVRNVAQWAGGIAASYGWLTADQGITAAGLVVSLVTFAYSMVESRKAGDAQKTVKAIAANPDQANTIIDVVADRSKAIEKIVAPVRSDRIYNPATNEWETR